MVEISDVYGGNYLNAATLKSEGLVNKSLTIDGAEIVELGATNPRPKVVLSFKETEKRLPLNKTNAGIISEVFGDETDVWVGKQIYLRITKRNFQGKIVDGIEATIREQKLLFRMTSEKTYKEQKKVINFKKKKMSDKDLEAFM